MNFSFFLEPSQELSQVIGRISQVFLLDTSSIISLGITVVQHFNLDAVVPGIGTKADRALLCITFVPHSYPAAPEPEKHMVLTECVLGQDKSSCI